VKKSEYTTRLQKLLAQFQDMKAHNQGREMLFVCDEDVHAVLSKACEE